MFYRIFIFYLSFFFIIYPSVSIGKINKDFSNLVFAGGGILGIAYVGALKAIEEHTQPTNNIKNVIGTSIGSIFATMTSLRYSSAEMKIIMDELNFKDFADQDITSLESEDIFGHKRRNIGKGLLPLILNKRDGFGLNSGEFLENWIEDLVAAKIDKNYATFRDLHENGNFAELYVVAANITDNRVEYFSFDHTPDVVISKAVRASTSMPIIFDVTDIGGKMFVDGGIYNKYPINFFNNLYKFEDTLGINFAPHKFFENSDVTEENMKGEFGWDKYILSIVASTFIAQHFDYINSNNPKHTITINTLGATPFNFNLSKEKRQELFEEGYRAALEYFKD
ncbi:MAG: patatin-like phospholipase family protein [Rickettsiaceae bacterium H1]|nr:patatin-like phospholipase family protein [Rickettsiaceae bacterium H1]